MMGHLSFLRFQGGYDLAETELRVVNEGTMWIVVRGDDLAQPGGRPFYVLKLAV
jgi:hypothetical protein